MLRLLSQNVKKIGKIYFWNFLECFFLGPLQRESYKWWYRIFLAVMDMSLFNAFVIWSQNDSSVAKKGYLDFLINLCQLIFDQKQAIPVEIPQISNRVSLTHSGYYGKRRRCKVFSTMEEPKHQEKFVWIAMSIYAHENVGCGTPKNQLSNGERRIIYHKCIVFYSYLHNKVRLLFD